MRTIRTKVYKFNELSEAAKQKAISKFSDINVDYEWWDFVYEDFSQICATIGIDVDLEKTYFSGFCHQGQGAAFTGYIDIEKLVSGIQNKKHLEYAPNLEKHNNCRLTECPIDKRILKLIYSGVIDIDQNIIAKERCYRSVIELCPNYTYNECINYYNIEKQLDNLQEWVQDTVDELSHLLFKLLEQEYEYLTSEDAIKETIEANDYEFTQDGNLFR